ncbi:amidohydrolase family protein [Magnetospirillum sp. 64-120]|uniref:amidohydrolase family protein n=1 Tax=Magnetospirillum sp. 64-120 TaxID=1895778 RepID=UPI0025C57BA7|nr:amidohydrolase family protein [Magnetospirillum sp. 64-120]
MRISSLALSAFFLGCGVLPSLAEPVKDAFLPLPPVPFKLIDELEDLNRPVRPKATPYKGPIYDTHVHDLFFTTGIVSDATLREDIDKAREKGVVGMIVLPTPNDAIQPNGPQSAKSRAELVKLTAPFTARMCGSEMTTWMDKAAKDGYEPEELTRRLTKLEQDLDDGCIGLGEFGPAHFDKTADMNTINFSMAFKPMVAVAELAARRGIPLDIHLEPRIPSGKKSYLVEEMAAVTLLCQMFPNLKLVLSHTAMTRPENVRALLEAFPNIMFDVKISPPGTEMAWDALAPVVNKDKDLYEDWAQLFEDHPKRFMVGTDSRLGEVHKGHKIIEYDSSIFAIRLLLGRLTPQAARLIGAGNARQLYGARNDGGTEPQGPGRMGPDGGGGPGMKGPGMKGPGMKGPQSE